MVVIAGYPQNLFVIILSIDPSSIALLSLLPVRPQSGYFGGGGVVDLTDDAASDYLKRASEMNA